MDSINKYMNMSALVRRGIWRLTLPLNYQSHLPTFLLRRKIWRMAVPVTLSMCTYTGIMVTDTIMVGQLGAEALATAGLGGMFLWTVLSFFLGGSMGVQIIVARRYGEKNYSAAANVLIVSLWLAAFIGGLLSLILYFVSPFIIPFLADGREFSPAVVSFVQIRFFGMGLYFLIFVIRAFFDGLGKTHLGFICSFVIMCANIFLNWVLIYGNLGFPAYGTDGASAASALAALPGLLCACCFFIKQEHRRFLRFSAVPLLPLVRQILRIGLPSALDHSLMNLSFAIFYKLAAIIGTLSVAATNILVSLTSISFMPGFGFAIAASTLLGQAVAVKKYRQAYYGVLCAATYCARIMGTLGLLFILMGEEALEFFVDADMAVVQEAYAPLILIGLMQIADAYQMTLGAALRSAGLVFWVLGVYALSSFLFMLPVAYALGIWAQWGTVGLWMGVALWLGALWLVFRIKFKGTSWKGKAV